MAIRRAEARDIPELLRLLVQVNMVHHEIRPDLFNGPATKYTKRELAELLADEARPVFVLTDEGGADQRLYRHALAYAGQIGCYNVTLNVWAGNDGALAFYQRMGLKIQKYGMEQIL